MFRDSANAHSAVMQSGTDDVHNCEVQPVKTTVQTVEVGELGLEDEAAACGRVASNAARVQSLPCPASNTKNIVSEHIMLE